MKNEFDYSENELAGRNIPGPEISEVNKLSSPSSPSSPAAKGDEASKKKDSLLAKDLAGQFQNQLVFDSLSGDWYEYKNGIWVAVSKNHATKLINERLHDFLPTGFPLSKLSGIEGFLKLYLSLDEWESNKNLLPLKNGILNAKTREIIPYSASHKFNWQLPYAYDKKAEIKVIKRWLWNTSNEDVEVVRIIRAFFKIALTGGNIQKFLEVVGPGGTGKSTLIRLLIMLIGEENHAATNLKNLEQNRFEAATLYGKRLAIISDSSRYGGEVSNLKALTGGDPIRHERKNQQQSGSFVFSGVVVIASNEAIQSTDYSSGLARRRLPISFINKVTDEEKAKWRDMGGIETVMRGEPPGLLNCLSSINGNLSKSQRQHLVETNKIAAWIDDNLIIDEKSTVYIGASIKTLNDNFEIEKACQTKLYPNYFRWCDENGVMPIAVQRFSANLVDIAEHSKLPVELLAKSKFGRRMRGFKIRTHKHTSEKTPITKTILLKDEGDDGLRSGDEGDPPVTHMGDEGDEGDDKNLFPDNDSIATRIFINDNNDVEIF
jgi:putative DNA primase/helicase